MWSSPHILLAPKHHKFLKGLDPLEPEHALFSGTAALLAAVS